jgi:hypothetical protein
MSIYLNPNQWSRRYRHGDGSNDQNAEYRATLYDVLPHSLNRYLSLSQGSPRVEIVKPHGPGYKIIANVKRNQSPDSSIEYHRNEIRVPISNGYPVVTPNYAVIPINVFDYSDHAILSSIYPRRDNNVNSATIPRIIHGTFESLVVPSLMKDAIDSWRNDYPTFEYRYHTDNDRIALLRDHFEPRVLKAYHKFYPNSFKSDLWKPAILYDQGGIYSDIKMHSVNNMQEIIDNHDLVIGFDRPPNMMFSAFCACTPRHPYLKILIDHIVHNAERNSYGEPYGLDSLNISGPGAFYEGLRQYLGEVPSETGSYIHCDGTRYYLLIHKSIPGWTGNPMTNGVIDANDNVYVHTRHSTNPISNELAYQTSGKEHYSILYEQRRIYIN